MLTVKVIPVFETHKSTGASIKLGGDGVILLKLMGIGRASLSSRTILIGAASIIGNNDTTMMNVIAEANTIFNCKPQTTTLLASRRQFKLLIHAE